MSKEMKFKSKYLLINDSNSDIEQMEYEEDLNKNFSFYHNTNEINQLTINNQLNN